MTKDNGVPAFPISVAVGPSGDVYHSGEFNGEGLTKREYAAIQIMAAMRVGSDLRDHAEADARVAVLRADALLAELGKDRT